MTYNSFNRPIDINEFNKEFDEYIAIKKNKQQELIELEEQDLNESQTNIYDLSIKEIYNNMISTMYKIITLDFKNINPDHYLYIAIVCILLYLCIHILFDVFS
jgi:DNA mismatch repair ATPase MutS